jgi:hypothetical protein
VHAAVAEQLAGRGARDRELVPRPGRERFDAREVFDERAQLGDGLRLPRLIARDGGVGAVGNIAAASSARSGRSTTRGSGVVT